MKKLFTLKLCIAAALLLVLCGCGTETPKPTYGTMELPEPPSGQTQNAVIYDDALLSQLDFQKQFRPEGFEEAVQISYHFPQVCENVPGAADFNGIFKNICREAETQAVYERADWTHHWNGSLLSVILEVYPLYQPEPVYITYNFDLEAGRMLGSQELFQVIHVTADQVTEALRCAAAQAFDRIALGIWDMYGDCLDTLFRLRAQTISADNLHLDNVAFYLQEGGILHAMVPVGTTAGDGSSIEDLRLDMTQQFGVSKVVSLGNVTARLENNRISLTFSQQKQNESTFNCERILYGKEYPVKGLYGRYQEIALGYMGNDGVMYLCAADDQGLVSICNLSCGAAWGGDFCAIGPLPEPRNIRSFMTLQDEGGYGLYACDQAGVGTLLSMPYLNADSKGSLCIRDTSWISADGRCTLRMGISEYGAPELFWDGGVLASGIFNYAGMTEQGMHYSSMLFLEETGVSEIRMTVSQIGNQAEQRPIVTIESMAGTVLPGMEPGQPMVLYESFG